MPVRYLALWSFCALALSACQPAADRSAELQAAWDDMMRVHDDVMPQMSGLNRVKTNLRTRLEAAPESLDAELRQAAQDAVAELEAAQEGMMAWMSGLRPLDSLRAGPAEEALAYLETEQTRIEAVQAQMETALQRGQDLLARLEPAEE